MNHQGNIAVSTPAVGLPRSLSVGPGACTRHVCVIYLEGSLRLPLDGELRCSVRALLRQGKRHLVLDLTRVSRIDAAGVGELVRAYNMAKAADAALEIVNPTNWVRHILERVRLFPILAGGEGRSQ